MDFRIGLFSALLLLASCGTSKKCCEHKDTVTIVEETVVDDTLVVENTGFSGTILTHHQHCGGMRPTPEQENGYNQAVENADFYIYQGSSIPTKKSDFTKITTNKFGVFSLELALGSYHIIQANKLLSLEKFIEVNNPNNKNYKVAPPTCFEKWKNSPDFSFVVTKASQEEVFIESHRCFTGANPCLKYDGPYPP